MYHADNNKPETNDPATALGEVAAVVVTYNRQPMLARCLSSLECQSINLSAIFVIDNHSLDNTQAYLASWSTRPRTHDAGPIRQVQRLGCNAGGAGGFNIGMRMAVEAAYDWIWVMDDDVIPSPTALVELLRIANGAATAGGFYVSTAYDASHQHVINVPVADMTPGFQGYPAWGQHLGAAVVRIRECTFVSTLFPRTAILTVGLPIKELFIWGDDTEYTRRMVHAGINGYWVGHSVVTHLRSGSSGLSIRKENERGRLPLYRYFYRNAGYLARKQGIYPFFQYIRHTLFDIASLCIKYRQFHKALLVLKALFESFLFHPQMEIITERPRPSFVKH